MFVGSSNHPSEDLNVYASAFNKSLSLLKKLLKKGAKKLLKLIYLTKNIGKINIKNEIKE